MKTFQYLLNTLLAAVLVGSMGFDANAQNKELQNFRPYNQDGVNVFESLKRDTTEFKEVKVYMGGAFAQQFQALEHETGATIPPGQLADIGPGFNLATANLYMDAQLADGIRLNLTTYLSSRHHPEAWVKGGYMLVDDLPMMNNSTIDGLMEYLTIKVGHMEINYGDTHFRRTDNARAIYNPFVGNYILDSFNTEVGAEFYYTNNGMFAMLGLSNGELNPSVTNTDSKSPSIYGKVGYDKQFGEDKRFRITGSYYHTAKSAANHLYSGDRAGSRYYNILDGGFRTPRITPGLSNRVDALMLNPFVKLNGLEVFGVIETASGNAGAGQPDKSWNQLALDVIYRFLENDQLFVGGRYNYVSGEEQFGASLEDVTLDRIQIGAGWYLTKNILVKVEYMMQNYNDYPTIANPGDSRRYYEDASVNGFMIEGAIGF